MTKVEEEVSAEKAQYPALQVQLLRAVLRAVLASTVTWITNTLAFVSATVAGCLAWLVGSWYSFRLSADRATTLTWSTSTLAYVSATVASCLDCLVGSWCSFRLRTDRTTTLAWSTSTLAEDTLAFSSSTVAVYRLCVSKQINSRLGGVAADTLSRRAIAIVPETPANCLASIPKKRSIILGTTCTGTLSLQTRTAFRNFITLTGGLFSI
jgi:hypothetical protein